MKYIQISVLMAMFTLAISCNQGAPDGVSLSDLKFSEYEVDLGEIYQQHTYDLEYPFTVDGDDPITIAEIDVSCGCTNAFVYPSWDTATHGEVWPLTEPIPAGAKGVIRATFDGSRYKREKSATITLSGNFLERKTTLGVKAYVKPVFEVKPQNINFGEILTSMISEQIPEKTITVIAKEDYQIERWVRVPKGLSIEEIGELKKLEGNQVSRQYRLTINSNVALGPMASSVDAETSLGINLEFTVAARILGPVRYSPAQRVAFGIFDQGQARRRTVKVEATAAVVKLPKPKAEIVGGAAGAVEIAAIKPINDGKGYEIKMLIDEKTEPGNYNGLLKISYPTNPEFSTQDVILNARVRKK
ncbi:MAG: DUF1573 domain-containing protein [Planctomycetota bacterium]|nr:DUF1573 domain-containing protein [Planctomycetota bacterium]